MKIYIAAPWVRKSEAIMAAWDFEQAGFTITKRWWEHREVPGYLVNDHDNAELRQQADEDMRGVHIADLFVLLNYEKSEGKAVETGFALAAGIPILLVGGKSNLFHYSAGVTEAGSVGEAVEMAKVLRFERQQLLEAR